MKKNQTINRKYRNITHGNSILKLVISHISSSLIQYKQNMTDRHAISAKIQKREDYTFIKKFKHKN